MFYRMASGHQDMVEDFIQKQKLGKKLTRNQANLVMYHQWRTKYPQDKEKIEKAESGSNYSGEDYKQMVLRLPPFHRRGYDKFWEIMRAMKKKGWMNWRVQRQPKQCETCDEGATASAKMANLQDALKEASANQKDDAVIRINAEIKALEETVATYHEHLELKRILKPWISDYVYEMEHGVHVLAVHDYGGLYAWNGWKFFVFVIALKYLENPEDELPVERAHVFFGQGRALQTR